MSDDPVITDAEVDAAIDVIECAYNTAQPSSVRQALSAFLKARVPEPIATPHYDPVYGSSGGWNACREAVLRGKP